MKIIEDYLDLESAALRLLKTGKDLNDHYPAAQTQRNKQEDGLSKENGENSKTDELSRFEYSEYYKKQGFDPRAEIGKERKIQQFFKEKFRLESEDLAENPLKEFLNESPESEPKGLPAFITDRPPSQIKGPDINLMVLML